ncbi:hypothetical protein [Isoptericola sp. NPDC056605]|uniref:hypothetical protein n=1 Tax=Isoptericola sp. NPDC056605 TaxID=3345876 RepID=UPI0036B16182
MGIGDTIAPNSDQLDAVDLLSGPRTFTVERVVVREGAEQPVNVHLKEFPRPWRPGKSMRRVLVDIWGEDETAYVGRRLTLWCDPRVKFGGEAVGGVRITHMSHLDKPRGVPLIITRGKSGVYPVKPLADDAPDLPAEPQPTAEQVAASTDLAELRDWWRFPGLRGAITARNAELEALDEQQGGEE